MRNLGGYKTISKIVNGKGAITPEMALRLSRALDTSPELWLNMQVAYDLWQASHKSSDWRNVTAINTEAICDTRS